MIFDLIGYWGAVTLIVGVTLFAPFTISTMLLDLWICRLTDKTHKDFLWSRLPEWFKHWHSNAEFTLFVSCLLSILSTFFVLILPIPERFQDKGITTSVDLVSYWATNLAPIFSWVVSVGLALFVVDFLSRKGWKLYTKISKLVDKE